MSRRAMRMRWQQVYDDIRLEFEAMSTGIVLEFLPACGMSFVKAGTRDTATATLRGQDSSVSRCRCPQSLLRTNMRSEACTVWRSPAECAGSNRPRPQPNANCTWRAANTLSYRSTSGTRADAVAELFRRSPFPVSTESTSRSGRRRRRRPA
jgi:hypothetical protein